MYGFRKDHWAQLKQLFDEQFEPDGDKRYFYRRSQKGVPTVVTGAEREHFIEEYSRRLRYGDRAMIAGLLLFTAAVIWWTFETDSEFPDVPIYVGIGGIAAATVAYTMWTWGAPARELHRRAPAGSARSSAEMRRRALEKMSYGQLAGAAFAGVVLPLSVAGRHDVFHGWGRLWLLCGSVIVILAAVQAF